MNFKNKNCVFKKKNDFEVFGVCFNSKDTLIFRWKVFDLRGQPKRERPVFFRGLFCLTFIN